MTNIIKKLMNRVWEKYEYASILYTKSTGKSYLVSAQGLQAAQNELFCQDGYVLKAWSDGVYAEYSFNSLKEEQIEGIVEAIDNVYTIQKKLADFNANTYPMPEESQEERSTKNEFNNNPEKCSDGIIIERLTGVRNYALGMNEKIYDCRVGAQYKIYTKYFLSPKRELSQSVLWMTCNILMMAKKDGIIKSYYKAYSNRDGMAVLDKMKDDIGHVAESVVELLDAESIKPGEYECICTPEVTGMIAHEAFGHGVEMDMFVKDRALAKDYIGKKVASELVTMHDGAASALEVATYDFDDEGQNACDTVIIDKGILKGGICDLQSASALKCRPTGNGRRESFERKAYTRMTNTFFEGGKDSLEDMIKSIKYGFILENATCGMEDPKNWGIQCMVNMAREIVDGKLTGKIFSPIVLSGYVPDLLKSITMMSPKVELCGSGFCGKGYKEWVKVSDGGPYIKARIRLG